MKKSLETDPDNTISIVWKHERNIAGGDTKFYLDILYNRSPAWYTIPYTDALENADIGLVLCQQVRISAC